MAAAKIRLHQPESFTAKTSGAVSGNGVPKTTGKGKTYPVMGQIVLQYKKLRAPASIPFSPAKNLFDLVLSL
jgi:hypothetical protein